MRRAPVGELTGWFELLASAVGVGLAVVDEEGRYLFVNPVFHRIRVLPDGPGLGRRAPYGPAEPHETVLRDVIERVRGADAPVNAGSIMRDGRSWEIIYVPLEVAGRFAVGVAARDSTERDAALAEAKTSASRHQALAEFSRSALLAGDPDALFDEAVALLARELGVALVSVLELLPGGFELSIRKRFGFRPVQDGGAIVAAGGASQAGYTLSIGEPVVVEDLATEQRFDPPAMLVEHGARSGISVPIRGGTRSWGVLAAHTTHVRAFTDAEVYVVRTVANVLGAALARDAASVQLRMLSLQRRRLAQEAIESSDRERHRLADVLHDEVLQHLLFARQECASLVSDASEPAVARVRQGLDAATKLLRDAVSDLHPITLAHVGLRATVRSLAREHAERGGFEVRVLVDEDHPTLHDRLIITAVRELLTNVVKHARASSVEVVVTSVGHELVCEVSDDGVGLDPAVLRETVRKGHVGLASLLERVEAMGGRGELATSWDGRGARVRLALPLP